MCHKAVNFTDESMCVCARVRVCVCVCVCVVCLYYSLVKASFVCKISATYLKGTDQQVLVQVLLPSYFNSVSQNVIFHLQIQKLQHAD